MKRGIILETILAASLAFTACGSQSGTSSTRDSSVISGFDKYTWGESINNIKADDSSLSEIETGIDGMAALSGTDSSIYAIPATVLYCFDSDGLEAIVYDTTESMTDEQYKELCDRLIDSYGQADVSKESTGWGQCSVWVDDSKDYAFVSQMDYVAFSEHDSLFTESASDTLENFHEIDLKSLLKK